MYDQEKDDDFDVSLREHLLDIVPRPVDETFWAMKRVHIKGACVLGSATLETVQKPDPFTGPKLKPTPDP